MENIVLVIALVVIIAFAAFYVYKAKKSGKKCIGCPESGNGCCSCNCSKN